MTVTSHEIGCGPLTYSVDAVAGLLGIARGVAYECVRNGSIPATRVGRRWLIPRKRFHAHGLTAPSSSAPRSALSLRRWRDGFR
jgi:excisionase family DNA binding protein